MVNLVCSLVLNVNPFMTDIFPEQLTTDQIVDHQQPWMCACFNKRTNIPIDYQLSVLYYIVY